MKILFLSNTGTALPLAMMCEDHGHAVRLYMKDKDCKDIGDGLVKKIDDYESSIPWADLVITDDTALGKLNDEIRAKGIPVIGGTEMTDVLEDDRELGQKMFESAGFDVLESNDFKTIEEAIEFIQDSPDQYVIKASGKAQEDKTTSYVGQMDDGSDLLSVLEHMGSKIKNLDSVEVQEHMEGQEVAVGGFFNGKKFIGPCFVNFEHKKLMPWSTQAGIGLNTGEMGTVGFWMDQDIPLFEKVLAPMIGPLKEMGYHGYFDINCIVADGKIYPLEMTTRFGWPTLLLQLETLKENNLGEMFLALASGKDFDIETSHPVSLCVVIGVPPLPYENKEIFDKYSRGLPILSLEGIPDGFYPGEVKMEEDQWVVAGQFGYVGVAAAGGDSVEECQAIAYEIADQVIVPNKMIRDDIGRTTDESMKELEDMGLLGVPEEVEA